MPRKTLLQVDDMILASLKNVRVQILEQLDAAITRTQHRINTRWERMPLGNIQQARAVEIQRLVDCGIDLKRASEMAAHDCNVTLSVRDPKGTKEPKVKTWYNVKTDVEWGWRDVGDRHYSEYIWAQSCTNASRYNPIRAYQRKKMLAVAK